ncbi:MAG TPA: hypothetical protein VN823_24110 [Stellaceae bacterium]|nr:hypothetical protein [Stellaceae bacterium]
MAADSDRSTATREAVASFATKPAFREAVAKLVEAGFEPIDISVLGTHESLETVGNVAGYPGTPAESLRSSLADEVGILVPLTIAGIAFLSGGAVAAALAALVGAGLGGMALKEVLDRYSANRHSADFAAALEKGAVLLWVRIASPEREATALRLLEKAGGGHVHVHVRTAEATRH